MVKTQAAKTQVSTWLSIADAGKQGIDVEPLGSGPVDASDAKEAMLVIPADCEEARREALAAIKVDDLRLPIGFSACRKDRKNVVSYLLELPNASAPDNDRRSLCRR